MGLAHVGWISIFLSGELRPKPEVPGVRLVLSRFVKRCDGWWVCVVGYLMHAFCSPPKLLSVNWRTKFRRVTVVHNVGYLQSPRMRSSAVHLPAGFFCERAAASAGLPEQARSSRDVAG